MLEFFDHYPRLKLRLRHVKSIARNAINSFGVYPRTCTVCGYHGKFLGLGSPQQIDGNCPRCTAGPRQRFTISTLRKLDLVRNKRVLHIAPELEIGAWIKANGAKSYKSGDLYRPADIKLNIEKMDLPSQCFDFVVCMHVLEHVDDGKALSEIHRILAPNGYAFIMVPVIEGWASTYENPAVTTELERLIHFGQGDHVRFYGHDVRDRLGKFFDVEEITACEPEVTEFGFERGEKIFLCKRVA